MKHPPQFLHVRVTKELKDKLKEAAALASQEQGRVVTMSALVADAALKECQRLFRKSAPGSTDHRDLTLSKGSVKQKQTPGDQRQH